jgi:hypothetical protein
MTAPEAVGLFVMGVDWTDGRTPTYERHHAWVTTEAQARAWFADLSRTPAAPSALIGHGGRILAVRP